MILVVMECVILLMALLNIYSMNDVRVRHGQRIRKTHGVRFSLFCFISKPIISHILFLHKRYVVCALQCIGKLALQKMHTHIHIYVRT